ncbi:MAG: hypothetical protein FWG89_01300 [Treponema sp.]|nr:hypothetical protein [Treponema sp.]
MKKVLVVIFGFVVVMGAFAEFTVNGGLRMNFGTLFNLADEDIDPMWRYDLRNTGTFIQTGYRGNNVNAWARWRGDGSIWGNATASFGAFRLSLGHSWLPWTQLSSYELYGVQNNNFGASAVNDLFIQIGYMKDGDHLYAGISEGRGVNGSFIGTKEDDASYRPFPALYAGYDYVQTDVFSAGGAFTIVPRGKAYEEGNLPFLFNVHGKLFSLNPVTLGLNIGFYSAPANALGYFNITGGAASGIIQGGEALVLETMLDLRLAIPEFTVLGFSGAFITNLADEDKGGGDSALQFGLSAAINLGGTGFSLVPGIGFNVVLTDNEDRERSGMDIGITLRYSF